MPKPVPNLLEKLRDHGVKSYRFEPLDPIIVAQVEEALKENWSCRSIAREVKIGDATVRRIRDKAKAEGRL